MKRIVLSIFIFFVASLLQAESLPDIKAKTSHKEATIGDVISLTVIIKGKDLTINKPEEKSHFPETKKGEDSAKEKPFIPLYKVENVTIKMEKSAESPVTVVQCSLIYYQPGTYSVPEVGIIGGDGLAVGYNNPEITIKALNPQAKAEDFESPFSIESSYTGLILLIAFLLVLAGTGIFFWNRFRNKTKGTPIAQGPDALEEFIAECQNIRQSNLLKEELYKDFANNISQSFKRYCGNKFSIDAEEMTGSELNSWLRKNKRQNLTHNICNDISSVMGLWDLAKFAQYEPNPDDLHESLETVIFIAKTIDKGEWPSDS